MEQVFSYRAVSIDLVSTYTVGIGAVQTYGTYFSWYTAVSCALQHHPSPARKQAWSNHQHHGWPAVSSIQLQLSARVSTDMTYESLVDSQTPYIDGLCCQAGILNEPLDLECQLPVICAA